MRGRLLLIISVCSPSVSHSTSRRHLRCAARGAKHRPLRVNATFRSPCADDASVRPKDESRPKMAAPTNVAQPPATKTRTGTAAAEGWRRWVPWVLVVLACLIALLAALNVWV